MLDREWWLRNKDSYVNCHKCDATFHHQFRRRGVFFPDGAVLCDECHERMHAGDREKFVEVHGYPVRGV